MLPITAAPSTSRIRRRTFGANRHAAMAAATTNPVAISAAWNRDSDTGASVDVQCNTPTQPGYMVQGVGPPRKHELPPARHCPTMRP